jgi:CHAD domain-containing protein/CYTH domain-containing protein
MSVDLPLPDDLLDLPVERGARVVALTLLRDAATTRARLIDPRDTEALHDFRVAVRRLRSWLRAYRPFLGRSVRGKDRARLRAVAQATSVARDTEVHLAWLRDEAEHLDAPQRAGANFLRRHLEARKRAADAELHAEVGSDFVKASEVLITSLPVYVLRGRVDEPYPARVHSMAAATADRITRGIHTLRDRLSRVQSIADQPVAHKARIEGKRLRYLLEPIADRIDGGKELVKQLKALQDIIGELHDASIFVDEVLAATEGAPATHAARAGLVALVEHLRRRQLLAFTHLEQQWLGEHAHPFVESALAVAARLAARATAGTEIERKYLLQTLPEFVTQWPAREIEQGYIPGDRLAERLRHVRDPDGEHWYRTVKLGTGISRLEIEEETTPAIFETMWPATEGHRVYKRRYSVAEGARTWEIDEFIDRDLVLAEIELADPDEPVDPPAWLAPCIIREVTGETEYVNLNLAR